MSNKYGVLITECPASFPHKAHSWREGFLWLKKQTCRGLTQEEVDALGPWVKANPTIGVRIKPEWFEHKHKFFLSRLWTTKEELVFICDAYTTTGCKIEYRFERDDFWQ